MFNNIGKKIKSFAEFITLLGIVASVIIGFIVMSTNVLVGLLVIILGSLVSWLSSFLLYGFGELIDQTARISNYLCADEYTITNCELCDKETDDLVQIEIADDKIWVCKDCADKNRESDNDNETEES